MSANTTKVAKSSGQFQKGHSKLGGRTKGTPNKKTQELSEILGSFNPVEKLIELYNKTDDLGLKVDICKGLMKYIYPQRKAVDINTGNDYVVYVNHMALDVERDCKNSKI